MIDNKVIENKEKELAELKKLYFLQQMFLQLGIDAFIDEFIDEYDGNDTKTLNVLYLSKHDDDEYGAEIYFEDGDMVFNDVTNRRCLALKVKEDIEKITIKINK